MLVYLDTWVWSRIIQARAATPRVFETFLGVWNENACKLAVSRTHLFELRRHGDPITREYRYQLIEALLPGRFDMLGDSQPIMNTVSNREIAMAYAKSFNLDVLKRADRYWAGFPLPLLDQDDVSVLRQLEDPVVGAFLHLLHDALGHEATERRRSRLEPYKRFRLTSIPTEKFPRSQVDILIERLEQEVMRTPFWGLATKLVPAAQMGNQYAEALRVAREVLIRASQVGLRKAFTEFYASPHTRQREFTDTIIQQSGFNTDVEEILRTLCGLSNPIDVKRVASIMTVDQCPGTWIRNAVEIELRKSKSVPEPNDWFDLDHLTHLPYVDLFLSDAELVNNTMKVFRRLDSLPDVVRGVRPPLHAEGSLQGLIDLIKARAEEGIEATGN